VQLGQAASKCLASAKQGPGKQEASVLVQLSRARASRKGLSLCYCPCVIGLVTVDLSPYYINYKVARDACKFIKKGFM
jgi:hypothetical protein